MSYRLGLFLAFWVAVLLIGVAQERPSPEPAFQTRHWRVDEVPAALAPFVDYRATRVDVIETAGVCLYLARVYGQVAPTMAAVPKTQLPVGAGCQ